VCAILPLWNRQANGVANAPYTLSFSTGQVYNGGTQYLIGSTAWPSERGDVFTIPVSGGAGPCPNGAMRSGTLTLTCGAASTTFSVAENPMCTYAMTYTTTQACPSAVPASYFNDYQARPQRTKLTEDAHAVLVLTLTLFSRACTGR
jgi:hypothetical protein